jgi:hypothetical protein
MSRLHKVALYSSQILIIIGVVFYYGLKAASGHNMVWYGNEIGVILLAAISFIFGFMLRLAPGNRIVRLAGILIYLSCLIVGIRITYFMVTFEYGNDVSPFLLYFMPIVFCFFLAVILHFLITVKNDP